jgi:hypothetical protein
MRTPASTPGPDTGRAKTLGTGVTNSWDVGPVDPNGDGPLPNESGQPAQRVSLVSGIDFPPDLMAPESTGCGHLTTTQRAIEAFPGRIGRRALLGPMTMVEHERRHVTAICVSPRQITSVMDPDSPP